MDPETTLQNLLDALEDGDREEAYESAADLAAWLRGNGFTPEMTARTRRRAIWQLIRLTSVSRAFL